MASVSALCGQQPTGQKQNTRHLGPFAGSTTKRGQGFGPKNVVVPLETCLQDNWRQYYADYLSKYKGLPYRLTQTFSQAPIFT